MVYNQQRKPDIFETFYWNAIEKLVSAKVFDICNQTSSAHVSQIVYSKLRSQSQPLGKGRNCTKVKNINDNQVFIFICL